MTYPDFNLEKELLSQYPALVGIDEVGRGPLAGPVVAGCVVVNHDIELIEGVRDSKTLSEKQRKRLVPLIKKSVVAWGIGMTSCGEIDLLGISQAVKLAMQRSIENLSRQLATDLKIAIIDGSNVLSLDGIKCLKIKKGDMLHYSIAAASILAKEFRDNLMQEYAKKYPEYGFDRHVGYGTKQHLEALNKFGICPIHRRSFKPVREREDKC